MIRIEHIALYVQDLELMRIFYETYFKMSSGPRYHNKETNFSSYFLQAGSDSTRIELMIRPGVEKCALGQAACIGLTHFAFSLGSKIEVDALTERIRVDGFLVLSDARTTGDGYYESVIADPEGNRIELTV